MLGRASGSTAEPALSFWRCLVSTGYCFRVYIFLFVPTIGPGNFNLFKKTMMKILVDIDLRDHLSMEPLAIAFFFVFSITLVVYDKLSVNIFHCVDSLATRLWDLHGLCWKGSPGFS